MPSPPQTQPQKAVKRYRRAADGRAETADDVRSLLWLDRTVSYLWETAWAVLADVKHGGDDVPRLVELYDFLSDRFQAVRKDMVVQGLGGPGGRAIFQRIVRFHIFFGYLLSEQVGLWEREREGGGGLVSLLYILTPTPAHHFSFSLGAADV